MRRQFRQDLLITSWPSSKQRNYPHVREWFNMMILKHEITDEELRSQGLDPDKIRYYRYEMQSPRKDTVRKICYCLSQITGIGSNVLYREVIGLI